DLDTGAVLAAEVHPADQGDTTTLTGTLDAARRNLTSVGAPPSPDDPAECVADKGYHSRAVLTDLDGGPWKTRIAEPQRRGVARCWCVLILLPISDGAADAAILIVLLAHSAIPALIVVNMRLDRRPD